MGDSVVFNDLRFGQIIVSDNPKVKFVFHYYLNKASDNTLVMQQGVLTDGAAGPSNPCWRGD